jgi:hypothetical protein
MYIVTQTTVSESWDDTFNVFGDSKEEVVGLFHDRDEASRLMENLPPSFEKAGPHFRRSLDYQIRQIDQGTVLWSDDGDGKKIFPELE